MASARGHVETKTNQGSRIDYITEKPDFHQQLGMRRATILGQYQSKLFFSCMPPIQIAIMRHLIYCSKISKTLLCFRCRMRF